MSLRAHACACALLFALFTARAAHAQENNKFAIGVSFSDRAVSNSIARGSQGPGITWRIGHDTGGWGWQYGFSWFSADLDEKSNGQKSSLGEVRVRPVMAGYGYTWVVGRFALTGDLIGGYAFTKVTTTPLGDVNLQQLKAGATGVRDRGAPVIKPELSCWIDLNRRFGVSLNAGYIVARPRVFVGTNDAFRADTLSMTTGLVVRLF
jgi:hypothetical protein